MRDAKKHQHLQSREIGILHLEKKRKEKKSCRFGERGYMFFGVGSVVGPEPMFGQRCSYVPALAVGLGPSPFCALLSKQVCMVTSAKVTPTHVLLDLPGEFRRRTAAQLFPEEKLLPQRARARDLEPTSPTIFTSLFHRVLVALDATGHAGLSPALLTSVACGPADSKNVSWN